MNPPFPAVVAFLVAFLALVVVTQWLYKTKLSSEQSRKFLHVSGGTLALLLPWFIQSHLWVLLLCSLSFLLLSVTYLLKKLPSVHQTKRFSVGSLVFPVPVYFCFLAAVKNQDNILFYLPVSLMTYSDTLAEWGGKKWGSSSFTFFNRQKSLAGSLCFAVSAFIISLSLLAINIPLPLFTLLGISFLVTITATTAELVSLKGWDNLSVPLTVLFILYSLLTFIQTGDPAK